MIPKLNQPFKTTDLLSLGILLTIVVTISGVIISREMQDIDRSMALNEAETLAFQLIHGGFHTQSDRGPASVKDSQNSSNDGLFNLKGEIGQDPWGHPFKYKVVRDGLGIPTHVIVWSQGPNTKRETPEENFELAENQAVDDIEFLGDDFGSIHSIQRVGSN